MTKKKDSFESAIEKLESVISDLEDENITLEKALKDFEQGVALMRICDQHLKNAEGRLKELLKGENGELITKIIGISLDSAFPGENDNE